MHFHGMAATIQGIYRKKRPLEASSVYCSLAMMAATSAAAFSLAAEMNCL